MTHSHGMSTTAWVVLLLTSGLVAAVISAIVTLLTSHYDHSFRRTERREQEEHEAKLRREAAHDAARPAFLPRAEQLVAWATRQAYEAHMEEGGDFYWIGSLEPTMSSKEEVLDAARHLMWGHPSGVVRRKAGSFFDAINTFWSEMHPDGPAPVTFEIAYGWQTAAEGLIEAVHTPEGTEL